MDEAFLGGFIQRLNRLLDGLLGILDVTAFNLSSSLLDEGSGSGPIITVVGAPFNTLPGAFDRCFNISQASLLQKFRV